MFHLRIFFVNETIIVININLISIFETLYLFFISNVVFIFIILVGKVISTHLTRSTYLTRVVIDITKTVVIDITIIWAISIIIFPRKT